MAQHKVKLFILEDVGSVPIYAGRCSCQPNKTYLNFRVRLEEAGAVDWPFEFYDFEEACKIKARMERVDTISSSIYVVKITEDGNADRRKRRRVERASTSPEDIQFQETTEAISTLVEFPPLPDNEALPESRVSVPDIADSFSHNMKSVLLPKEVEAKYLTKAEKMKKELVQIDLQDHVWHLKSWNKKDIPVVKLHCVSCNKNMGGDSGNHSKGAIHNLLNNFKKSHVLSTLHVHLWCRKQGLNFEDMPQTSSKKAAILTAADHGTLVDEGLAILHSVNAATIDGIATFVVEGDLNSQHLKSFWYKVHCKVCGDMMLLCPPKKNVKSNLEAHIYGLRHTKGVEAASALLRSASSALSTGRSRRPTTSTRSVISGQPSYLVQLIQGFGFIDSISICFYYHMSVALYSCFTLLGLLAFYNILLFTDV